MPTVANSSLTYEILMYLNSFYFGIFALSELTMGIIKAIEIPSPNSGTTITEFSLLIFLVATEGGRVYLGRKGNLTGKGLLILLGIALTIPCVLANLYFLFWQSCVFRLEVILCSIELVLLTSELVISVMCLIAVNRPPLPEE
ncbi:transmembrane protein 216-like isoform X1 [Fopius arisanus]|uniref:Transmembrane protein 216-like isoform X1 n=1 Tax=Fopius arisanus TaxID=64838 RepID=A0A9R1UBL0_9HYME|nr:PREDICTED: transmembrane protein 216-like isoform X1 [Fopius arisanus]